MTSSQSRAHANRDEHGGRGRPPHLRRIEGGHQRGLARRIPLRDDDRIVQPAQRQREVAIVDVFVVVGHGCLHSQPGAGHPVNARRSPRIFAARICRPLCSRDRTVPIAHPAATAAS